MRKLISSFVCFMMLSGGVLAVTTADTNYDIIGNGKSIYGVNSSGAAKQIIGINTSNQVSIDSDATGAIIGGTLTVTGATTFSADPTFSSATTAKPVFSIKNTNADATGNYFDLVKDSASPTDNDVISTIRFKGDDVSGNVTTFAQIIVDQDDVTNTTEDGGLDIQIMKAGTLTSALKLAAGALTLDVATGSATITTGNTNLTITVGGTTYYLKAHTSQ